MAVRVAPLAETPDDFAAWDRYVDARPDATIYHYAAWGSIFRRGFGYRCWLLAARDAAGGGIVGALPLYLVRTPFSRRLVAVPFRDRGGVLWDTIPAFEALLEACAAIAGETRADVIRLKSLVAYPQPQTGAAGLQEHRYWIRSTVDLRERGSKLWEAIGDKNRNMVRQARRNGLQCVELPVTAENIEQWHSLHIATQRRLGIPPFPAKFFAAMADELHPAGRFALFGVRRESTLHAATIILLHRNTAIYAYSASDSEGQRRRANDLMLFEVMQWLAGRGCTVFDMGSDSPKQENLLFFKRKWGADQAAIPHYAHGGPGTVDSSDAGYALARNCFRLLPERVFAALGTAITRYFG